MKKVSVKKGKLNSHGPTSLQICGAGCVFVCQSIGLSMDKASLMCWSRDSENFPVWYICTSKNGHAVTNLSSEDRFHIHSSKTAGNLCDI